ncbi:hypothetical protein DFP72DRAFT_1076626 [Ephemerocybe angulata]|uniref:Uncharacterized protein n=1 Tax=Ephemerocybe angulata TaxID=980116 RepID=A0A8H6HH10_9AGAR|nr:hypothetical protein DFP72DRAFT_1076626 [Tulosesus angulatus]
MPAASKFKPIHKFEHNDQIRFLNVCAFFIAQARKENRENDFLNQVSARYFITWPESWTPVLGNKIREIKAAIRAHMNWAYYATARITPLIHWEIVFALPHEQFDNLGRRFLKELRQLQKNAMKIPPALRKDGDKIILEMTEFKLDNDEDVEIVSDDGNKKTTATTKDAIMVDSDDDVIVVSDD